MAVILFYSQSSDALRSFYAARSAGPVIPFVRKALLATCIVCANINSSFASLAKSVMVPKFDSGPLVLNYAYFVAGGHFEIVSRSYFATPEASTITDSTIYWPTRKPIASEFGAMQPSKTNEQGKSLGPAWIKSNAADSIRYVRDDLQLKIAAYQSSLSVLSLAGLQRNDQYAGPMSGTIVGMASWYNPYRSNSRSPERKTASGDWYDPSAWTAAVQIDLRGQFGGVRYGKNYKPTYVLVESGGKEVIIKINDVGPLKPGRVIDLSERVMRYFDRSLQLGLLASVKVTPLPGEYWTPGPVGGERLISEAVAQAWDTGLLRGEGLAVDARLVEVDAVEITPLSGEDAALNPVGGERLISGAVAQALDAGLGEGEDFAIDARFVQTDTTAHCGQTPDEIDLSLPDCGSRTVAEFLSALADEDTQGDRKLPRLISAVNPCSGWSANANKWAQLGYEINCRSGLENVTIIDVEAPPRIYKHIEAVRTMLIRTVGRWGRKPHRPAVGTAYGTGGFSGWLIAAVIAPNSSVWEKDQRGDRTLSRRVIVSDRERNLSACLQVALLQTTGRVRDGPTFV